MGTYLAPNSKVSTMSRIEGSGGKINSFWAMYSFRMSFWMVPPTLVQGTPCFSAVTRYIAHSTAAGAFMVIEVVTLSRGMSLKRISISARELTATPHLPNSPSAIGSSVS